MLAAFTWFLGFSGVFDGVLLDLAIKATLILSLALGVICLLRRPSAALRHAIHSLALASLLFLPLLSFALPTWRIVLPIAIATESVVASPPQSPNAPLTPAENVTSLSEFNPSTSTQVSISPAKIAADFQPSSRIEQSAAVFAKYSLVAIAWLFGAGVNMIFTIHGLVRAHRFRVASTRITDVKWLADFEELTSGGRWSRCVQLLENPEASVPMMCGIVRPAIILPAGYQADTSKDRCRILTHELAHVERYDVAIHLVGRIVCSLYWFHPLAWWCLRKMQQEREFACDDWVLASGGMASEYAHQLLSVAHHHFASKRPIPGMIGVVHQTNLEQRIRFLLSNDANHSRLKGMALVISVALFALFTTGIAAIRPEIVQAAEPPKEESRDTAQTGQLSTGTENASRNAEDVPTGVVVTCIDQDGSPVGDAEVHLYQGSRKENKDGEYVHFGPYKSDKDGKVRCPDELFLTPERTFDRWVYARVPGRLVGVTRSMNAANRTPVNTNCVVKLQPSQVLDGQVKVPSGFDPTHIEIRVQVLHVILGSGDLNYESFPRHDQFDGLDEALPDIFTRRPDGEGRFQFSDVPVRGRLYLLAEGNGLGQAQWWNRSDQFNAPAELTMKPEGRLSGHVLTPDGVPVKDVEVSARIISNGNRNVAHQTTFRTRTDDRGNYSFDGLPDWDFVLSAIDPKEQWLVRPVEDIRINSGKTTEQNLVVEQGVRVSGRVFDSDGKPVESAALSAITDSQIGSGLSDDSTDSEGRYSLRLPSGKVKLYFNSLPPGFTYPEPQVVRELDIARGQIDLDYVDFTIPRQEEANAEEGTQSNAAVDEGSQLLRDLRAKSRPALEIMASQLGYGLLANELVRHVPLPFPPERMEFYRLGNPTQFEAIPAGPSAMTFQWNGEELKSGSMTFGDPATNGFDLAGVLNALVSIKSQRLEGPPELLNKRLQGDWVVRENGDKKAIVEQLEGILNADFDLGLKLTFRNVEREVYVARGNYKLTPVEGQNGDRVHIFAKQLVPNSGVGGGSGEFEEFLEWLGRWIGSPIVDEVESHPKRQISWELHERSPFTEQMRREDHDPKAVFSNVAAQTSLQFTKELREIELLFIEKMP